MWELIWEFFYFILVNYQTVGVVFFAFSNTICMLFGLVFGYSLRCKSFIITHIQFTLCHTTLIILTCFMTIKKNNFYQSFWKKCQKHNINRNNLWSTTARENTRFYTRLHILCNLINNISHRMFPINLISSWAWHHYGKNNWIFKMIYISLDNRWFSLSFCL